MCVASAGQMVRQLRHYCHDWTCPAVLYVPQCPRQPGLGRSNSDQLRILTSVSSLFPVFPVSSANPPIFFSIRRKLLIRIVFIVSIIVFKDSVVILRLLDFVPTEHPLFLSRLSAFSNNPLGCRLIRIFISICRLSSVKRYGTIVLLYSSTTCLT